MKPFNVLYDKWISVVKDDGTIQKMGLYEMLLHAHECRSIKISRTQKSLTFYNYVIMRFASTFLMDAYRNKLKRPNSIEKLLTQGKFEKEILDEYISLCEEEGVSFNLFDKDKPFMQMDKKTFDMYLKKKGTETDSVARVTPMLPSATKNMFTNHVDYDEYKEFYRKKGVLLNDNPSLTHDFYLDFADGYDAPRTTAPSAEYVWHLKPEEYFVNLLTCHFCSSAGGKGMKKGLVVMNGIPIFAVIRGNNLFETLTMMCISLGTDADKEYHLPMWRWPKYTWCESMEYSEDFGTLSGMFFPIRMIRFAENEDCLGDEDVYSVYFSSIFFENTDVESLVSSLRDRWTLYEPHVYYQTKKNVKKDKDNNETIKITKEVLTYDYTQQPWLDIISFCDMPNITNKAFAKIVEQYENFDDDNKPDINIDFYYFQRSTGQDKSFCTGVISHVFPNQLLFYTPLFETYKNEVITYANILQKNVVAYQKSLLRKENGTDLAAQNSAWGQNRREAIMQSYYTYCHNLFFDSLLYDENLDINKNPNADYNSLESYITEIIGYVYQGYEMLAPGRKQYLHYVTQKIQLDKDIEKQK